MHSLLGLMPWSISCLFFALFSVRQMFRVNDGKTHFPFSGSSLALYSTLIWLNAHNSIPLRRCSFNSQWQPFRNILPLILKCFTLSKNKTRFYTSDVHSKSNLTNSWAMSALCHIWDSIYCCKDRPSARHNAEKDVFTKCCFFLIDAPYYI